MAALMIPLELPIELPISAKIYFRFRLSSALNVNRFQLFFSLNNALPELLAFNSVYGCARRSALPALRPAPHPPRPAPPRQQPGPSVRRARRRGRTPPDVVGPGLPELPDPSSPGPALPDWPRDHFAQYMGCYSPPAKVGPLGLLVT
jgi:hypothetical protein